MGATRTLGRRGFLAGAGSAAAFAVWHGLPPWAGTLMANEARNYAPRQHDPRLSGLDLLTAAALDEMRAFYGDALGLPILEHDERAITIGAGLTKLTFRRAEPNQGEPWYHVAFNIPENKLFLARKWQLARTPLHQRPPGSSLAGYPDVADFQHWNAHAVFFWDPAGNLLEYIARHDLPNAAPGGFTSSDILYASEIGLIAQDVPAASASIRDALGWEAFRGAGPTFQPIGDDRGLIIVFPIGRDWGRADGLTTRVFPTRVTVRGTRPSTFELPEHPFRIETVGTARAS